MPRSKGPPFRLAPALEIDGTTPNGPVSIGNEALALLGVGFGYGNQTAIVSGNTGALRNIAGTNSWSGVIAVNNAANSVQAIGVDAGTLNLSGVLAGGVATGTLNKLGSGILELSGSLPNTITLATLGVLEGTLRLNKVGALATNAAIPTTVAALAIGDNIGGDDADQIVLAAHEQIGDATPAITMQSTGKFDLKTFNETTANATFIVTNGFGLANATTGISADIESTGTGTLTLASNLTVNNQGSTMGGLTGAKVAGTVALQTFGGSAAPRTYTVTDSVAGTDLLITAKLTDGDGNANLQGITVIGVSTTAGGLLELAPTVASDFSGVFTVGTATMGRARISNAGALGASGTGAGTTVTLGSLELNGVTIVDEPLSINTAGFGGRGGLVGVPGSGTSIWRQSAFVGQLVTMARLHDRRRCRGHHRPFRLGEHLRRHHEIAPRHAAVIEQ